MSQPSSVKSSKTAYDFSFTSLIGNKPLPLSAFEGKVLLIVNTASRCGFTSQYEGMQKLYDRYKDLGLVVLGVPSNDFRQELRLDDEIAHFCETNYVVTFPMARKESVTGSAAHSFYQWARAQKGWLAAPKWNFHKYLVDRRGNLADFFYTTTPLEAKNLIGRIEALLAAN